jgi:hypothetical protein
MTSHTIHANNYACVVLLLAVYCYVVNQFIDLDMYLVVAFMPINTHLMSYIIGCIVMLSRFFFCGISVSHSYMS